MKLLKPVTMKPLLPCSSLRQEGKEPGAGTGHGPHAGLQQRERERVHRGRALGFGGSSKLLGRLGSGTGV